MHRKLLLCLAISAALVACKQESPTVAATAPAAVSTHAFTSAITATDFGELVKQLASDEFEGRAPGSNGEGLTVNYIRDQMQRIGLQPGNGDSWFQDVPMTETTADPGTVLKIQRDGVAEELKFGTDMVIGTRTGQPQIRIDNSEMVFVGYGVDAPEQDWND